MVGDGNHFGGIETIVGGSLILAYALGRLGKLPIPPVGSSSYSGSLWLFFLFSFCPPPPLRLLLLFFPSLYFFAISLQDVRCFFLRSVWCYFRDWWFSRHGI